MNFKENCVCRTFLFLFVLFSGKKQSFERQYYPLLQGNNYINQSDKRSFLSMLFLSPIWRGFTPGFVNYKKGCTPLAATSDKAYQLLVHGRWFSLGTLASSTTF
jgi:hypothetical protein